MSQDLGKSLLANADILIENWIEAIREDEAIDSSKGLSDRSIRDHIPDVLEAIATMLSQSTEDRTQKLKDSGWTHGIVRAEQNYDLAEIVREYSLLRKIIFTHLKPDLQNNSGVEILQTVELIDSAIDCVIALSIETYVETRLKELEQVRGQLLLTNQELSRLVAMQKEDISHMAHELKSPLNAIMGFSTLLLQQQKDSSTQESTLSLQMTEKVINNSRQLLRLINDILEISRYDAGKVTPNIQSSDVRSLIVRVTETWEITANQKNVALILNCDRAPQQIHTDPLKLQQIVSNLIGNAIRYTESGTIAITCQTDNNNSWSLTVADTGIGMSPEAQAKIFEPYYRVSSKGNFSEDGTGLGLAIVDKLVKLLQGEITLASKLGEGSIFTVTFPLIDK